MPRFRNLKAQIRMLLEKDDWHTRSQELNVFAPLELLNPLLACLPQGGEITNRAAILFGEQIDRLTTEASGMEQARNMMRRLMWHMNEESGNIGWGIPEGFSAALAANRKLAEEFHRVLLSYIIDTGKDDNYCDHAPLRRSCYVAVETLLEAWPDLSTVHVRRALLVGQHDDPDALCRQAAQKALQTLQHKLIQQNIELPL